VVEAGSAAAGALQLEALDCAGRRIDVVSSGDAVGPHGRALITFAAQGISAIRVSTPVGRGKVVVHDAKLDRNFTLRSGQGYLARARLFAARIKAG
jgi:hypothetical protein